MTFIKNHQQFLKILENYLLVARLIFCGGLFKTCLVYDHMTQLFEIRTCIRLVQSIQWLEVDCGNDQGNRKL